MGVYVTVVLNVMPLTSNFDLVKYYLRFNNAEILDFCVTFWLIVFAAINCRFTATLLAPHCDNLASPTYDPPSVCCVQCWLTLIKTQ